MTNNNNVTIRRTAKQVKQHTVLMKALSLTCICLVVLASITYVASYLYDQFGSFTVSINKYDMVKQGLTLSETNEFLTPVSRLNAKAVQDITNISSDKIPADVDSINGSHNGRDYIAYTFYLKNVGEDTVSYQHTISIKSVTKNVDSAIRVKVYQNGKPQTYAKTKSDGSGAEYETKEFLTNTVVMRQQKRNFKPNDVDKYTVVIWLEGDDPDCVDALIGGKIKLEMDVSIIEGS